MAYAELFGAVQSGACLDASLGFKVCDKKLHEVAQEIAGKNVTHIGVEINAKIWRGIYCSASPLVEECFGVDTDIILTKEGMDEDWERFIFAKELVHIFDKDGLDNDDRLRAIFNHITNPTNPFTTDVIAEFDAVFLGLGLMCSEQDRLSLHSQYKSLELDMPDIARKLNLPEERVYQYFADRYPETLARNGVILEV